MSRRTNIIAAALSVLALGSPLMTGRAVLGSVYFDQGVEKFDAGNYQGAIDDFNKAIEIDPRKASTYVNRGITRALTKNLQGSCDDWRKAAEPGEKDAAQWVKQQC